jgi:hypothetical protein
MIMSLLCWVVKRVEQELVVCAQPLAANPSIARGPVALAITVTMRIVECDIEPLEPVTVTVYEPAIVLLVVIMEMVAVTNPPAGTVTVAGLMLTVGPAGLMAVAKLTVPPKLFTLVIVMVDVAEEPALMLRLLGLTLMAKSGVAPVENVAVRTVSGTEVGVPFAMVTHVFGDTLEFVQPVWNPKGIPDVVAVTL